MDAKTLQISLPAKAFDPLYSAARSLGVQMLSLRPSDCMTSFYQGNFTVRVSDPGVYRLHLAYPSVNGTAHVLANQEGGSATRGRSISSLWEVHGCGDVLVQEARKIEVRRREG